MAESSRSHFHRSFVLALSTALSSALAAQTVAVNTCDDAVDFAAPQTVAQLPGPDGEVSFREACLAANNTPGPQTIAFAIPSSKWWLDPKQALLRQEFGIFLLSDDATTVDFSTQTAFTGNTNPAGGEVGIFGLEPNAWSVASIYVTGDGCVVRGLDRVVQRGHGVQLVGNGNRVVGCTIWGPLYSGVYISGGFGGAPATGNVVGGTQPGEGNVLSSGNDGVRIDAPAVGNLVLGNKLSGSWHGVAVRGSQFTSTANGNRIGGTTAAERNVIAGAGHYGEEGFPVGAQVAITWADGTIVEGNYIGTSADGMSAAAQTGPAGIVLESNASNTIVRNNLISGIVVPGAGPHYAGQTFGAGIQLYGMGSGTRIEGNRIGTDATGQQPLANYYGIRDASFPGSAPAFDTRIGGALPGQANTIAFNQQAGVFLTTSIQGVRVSSNSIHSNGLLGIDLFPAGPSANDALDLDAGPNGLQNYPVLQSASADAASVRVVGALNSSASANFTLEFFASPQLDASGFGEGQQYLGSTAVATNALGNAAFDATLPAVVPQGWFVSATATLDASGSTSEFSAAVAVVPGAGLWANLGQGLAGVNGVPLLTGSGVLVPAAPIHWSLANAKRNTSAWFVVGASQLSLPILGGVLVPAPDFAFFAPTSGAGTASLSPSLVQPLPPGQQITVQAWLIDPAGAFGWAASNAIAASAP
ncbi:MAG: right-handed parallel beta-helix repeat-containing protein [Planctomycetota bacterium]|nr:MAG: right-handed parallel beta-helix repeat-containing protein [Planctomycetota bacterium]